MIVEPLVGIVFGSGVSAQPKLINRFTVRGAPLCRRIDGAERLDSVRVFAGNHAIPQQSCAFLAVVTVHEQLIDAVALVRQHVVGMMKPHPARLAIG